MNFAGRGLSCIAFLFAALPPALAEKRIELESIYVKGNKEFPQTLYIVPWQDVKARNRREQSLVLHSLFGDLFDPIQGMDARATHAPVNKP